jgi:hypothetical protein
MHEAGECYVHLRVRPGAPREQECLLRLEAAQGLGMYLIRLWYKAGGAAVDAPEGMITLLRWLAASLEQG